MAKAWGIIPHKNMFKFIFILLLSFNVFASDIPKAQTPNYNDGFFKCTILSDEAFIKMYEFKQYGYKEEYMSYIDERFSSTILYEFYMNMLEHIYSTKKLSIEESSDIFFKQCMYLVGY